MPLTLAVNNLDLTVVFYRDLLNQRVLRTPSDAEQDRAELLVDDRPLLTFVALPTMQQRHPALLAPWERHPLGQGLLISLAVEEICPILHGLKQADVSLSYEQEDTVAGRREVWLTDPDGYLVSLSSSL